MKMKPVGWNIFFWLIIAGCGSGEVIWEQDEITDALTAPCNAIQGKKFFGMFFEGAGVDTEGIEAKVKGTSADRITVVQDYKNTYEASKWLNSIIEAHNRKNVVHLNIMPEGPATTATMETNIRNFGAKLATELKRVSATIPGILITIGPEMNGGWTANYGCTADYSASRATEFKTMHNKFVDIMRAEFDKQAVPRSKLRIVWGPNVTPSGSDRCSYKNYFPGWNWIDYVGYSHYSFDTYQSGAAIVNTASAILQAAGVDPNSTAAHGKVIILQTGMYYGTAGHNRGAWFNEIVNAVTNDPRIAGMILFHPPSYIANEVRLRWLAAGTLAPLEGFSELNAEIASGTKFVNSNTDNLGYLFSAMPTLKCGGFAPTTASVSQAVEVRCDYGKVMDCITTASSGFSSCRYRSFAGTAAIFDCVASATVGSYSVLCKTFTGSPGACGATSKTIGTLKVELSPPVVLWVFQWYSNLVVKGTNFGSAGAVVHVKVTYYKKSGATATYTGTASVKKEDYDVLYIPLTLLPDFNGSRPATAVVTR